MFGYGEGLNMGTYDKYKHRLVYLCWVLLGLYLVSLYIDNQTLMSMAGRYLLACELLLGVFLACFLIDASFQKSLGFFLMLLIVVVSEQLSNYRLSEDSRINLYCFLIYILI